MENLTLEQIKRLAQQTGSPSLSIFLPTHSAGPEIQQDPIRFRNLLREAEARLQPGPLGPREVSALLQPAQALLGEPYFWQHQRQGLAVFIAPGDFHFYQLPIRVDASLVIARAYYIKPVLPLFTTNGRYYILALSQAAVRLFEGTRYGVAQVELPAGLPESLDEALQLEDTEKQVQSHSVASQGGGRMSMFHGQGPGGEEQKARIERYLNLVDAGLKETLGDGRAPLVLACVDYLRPIYQTVSDYPHLMSDGIPGNPEHLSPEALQARAWPIVEPYFRTEVETVLARYRQLASSGQATDSLAEIVSAAVQGRVEQLLVAVEAQVWGRIQPDTGQVLHSQAVQGPEDDLALLDFAAMQTVHKGGSVYALAQADMPTPAPIAALLRYKV